MMADNTPFQSFLPFNHLDHGSFNLADHEFSHGPLNYDANRLETLIFNSVERPELFNQLSSHLSPDRIFFLTGKFSDPDVIESLFLEIIVPHGKNIIVGCVYRPPNQNTAMFIEKFNNVLSLISKDNKHCYVMGDFNQDLLQYNHQVPTQEFIDSLSSHAFLPLIFNPTRLTSYSATLIDHIFTNKLAHSVFSGIILNDLSDHLPVFAYFDDTTLTCRRKRKIVMRTFNDDNLHKFNEDLSKAKMVLISQHGRSQ